jgi:hypothetical protein
MSKEFRILLRIVLGVFIFLGGVAVLLIFSTRDPDFWIDLPANLFVELIGAVLAFVFFELAILHPLKKNLTNGDKSSSAEDK